MFFFLTVGIIDWPWIDKRSLFYTLSRLLCDDTILDHRIFFPRDCCFFCDGDCPIKGSDCLVRDSNLIYKYEHWAARVSYDQLISLDTREIFKFFPVFWTVWDNNIFRSYFANSGQFQTIKIFFEIFAKNWDSFRQWTF